MKTKINLLGNEILCIEPETLDTSKKNIIFCHGFDSSHLGFLSIINSLKNKYNCFSLDYPAHGLSSGTMKDMRIPFFAEVIKEFIKVKQLNKVTLLGHSLGGGVVSYLEKEDFVESIILEAPINPSIAGAELGLADVLLPKTKQDYVRSLNLLVADKNNVNASLFGDKNIALQLKGVVQRRSYMMKVAKDVWNRERQWEITWNYLEFTKPTLLIFGDTDKIVPTEASIKWLEKLIKHIKTHVIKNCGHSPHFEKLEQTKEIIINFLG